MKSLLGLLLLAGWGFAIWMWVEALTVPGEEWKRCGKDKVTFFVWWYLGGFLTLGLVPVGMSVWYYRSLRPEFRANHATALPGAHQALGNSGVGRSTASGPPAAWYPDPQGEKRLRYWNGGRWSDHTAD